MVILLSGIQYIKQYGTLPSRIHKLKNILNNMVFSPSRIHQKKKKKNMQQYGTLPSSKIKVKSYLKIKKKKKNTHTHPILAKPKYNTI